MKRRKAVALVIVALMALSLLVVPAASARGTTRTPIDNWNINCSFEDQPGGVWMEDGILHVRGRVIYGFVFSDSDYHHKATALNVANANINPTTGYGNYWGTLEFHPDAYPDGYWAGSYSLQVTPGKMGGIARLKGYGTLEGLSTKSDLMPLPPDVLEQKFSGVCGEDAPVSGVHALGFVMNPGGE